MTILLSDPRADHARIRAMNPLAFAVDTAHSGAELAVDLSAIAANTRLFARRATGELMAVVKADGFGHGAVEVARTALTNGASRLGVTSIAEALALRAAGLSAPILSWLNPLDADYPSAVAAGIELASPAVRTSRQSFGQRRGRAFICTWTPAWPGTEPSRRSGPVSAPQPDSPNSAATSASSG